MDNNNGTKVSGRLKQDTDPMVCNLIYTPRLNNFLSEYKYLTAVNEAHLLMLDKQKIIDRGAAQKIAKAIIRIEAEGIENIELDPLREDGYFNYEAHLISITGAETGGSLHVGRSRNDILSTMSRLSTRDAVLDLLDEVCKIRRSLLDVGSRNTDAVMTGYTHLQPAQPMTFGFYLAAVEESFSRVSDRLFEIYRNIDCSPLGSAAFTGTSFDIDRNYTADLLGFSAVVRNTLDGIATRDYILETMYACSSIATLWSRVAQDFFIWNTDEFSLIEFPDAVAGTSSIMPQKKNPFVIEFLKGRSGDVLGMLSGALTTLRLTHFGHSGDANRESWLRFSEMVQECTDCLELFNLLVTSVVPKKENMLSAATENFCTVTDLADLLVKRSSVSFRQAHHIVGAVVREVIDRGLHADSITAKLVATELEREVGDSIELTDEELRDFLDPRSCVKRRSNGGPSPSSVSDSITKRLASLSDDVNEVSRLRSFIQSTNERRRAGTVALANAA